MPTERQGDTERAVRFLAENSPAEQLAACSDPDDCLFGSHPTLAELNRDYNPNMAAAWLLPQLTNLSEYCGAREKLTEGQLRECAHIIAQTYFYLKTTEVMLFLQRFKAGRYGRFYGNIDPLVIMSALRDFTRERSRAIDRMAQERAQREAEESRKKAVTWERYCEMEGIADRRHPLDRMAARANIKGKRV